MVCSVCRDSKLVNLLLIQSFKAGMRPSLKKSEAIIQPAQSGWPFLRVDTHVRAWVSGGDTGRASSWPDYFLRPCAFPPGTGRAGSRPRTSRLAIERTISLPFLAAYVSAATDFKGWDLVSTSMYSQIIFKRGLSLRHTYLSLYERDRFVGLLRSHWGWNRP